MLQGRWLDEVDDAMYCMAKKAGLGKYNFSLQVMRWDLSQLKCVY
jgi:hypothetical protein